jgi:hypothetical protein
MPRNTDRTHEAIVAADAAQLQAAIQSVTWERRGLLQRLVRTDSGARTDAAASQPGS